MYGGISPQSITVTVVVSAPYVIVAALNRPFFATYSPASSRQSLTLAVPPSTAALKVRSSSSQ